MNKLELTSIEKEMANFDFSALQAEVENSKKSIEGTKSAADVKVEICKVWTKIRKFVVLAENLPIVGKFIKILVNLLDSLCGV